MAVTDSLPAAPARLRRLAGGVRRLTPPVGEVRFWVVQAGLLTLAGLDAVVDVHRADLDHVPPSITTSLLLVPVIYAALNFGVRGAVVTAVWATALTVPHWVLIPRIGSTHDWTEVAFLLVLNAVAIVVGQRVEREQRARQRAETALRDARLAKARYQSLFEDQPAPVIITDAGGVVAEVNGAAEGLFATAPARRGIEDVLGVTIGELLAGATGCLTVTGRDGQEVLFVPTARRLATDVGTGMVQVVLTDVTEQHRRQQEQRMFATRLLRVQEEERRRLARELHDDPLQGLTYLTRDLEDLSQHPGLSEELAGRLRRGGALATDAATALRKLIQGLRPPVLDDLGLTAALNQLAEQVRRRGTLRVDVSVTGTPARLAPEVELTAYRIAQESLNNVLKHARASRVTIRLHQDEELVLSIRDDGRGLPRPGGTAGGDARIPEHPGPGAGGPGHRGQVGAAGGAPYTAEPVGPADGGLGLGLIGMRERVNMVGGILEVGPGSPRGTLVRASLPIARPGDETVPR